MPLNSGRPCVLQPHPHWRTYLSMFAPKFWEALYHPLLNGGYACLNSGRIVHPSSLEDSLEDVFPSILGGTVPPPWNCGMMFPHSFGMTYFRGCVPLSSWRRVDGGLSGGYVTQNSRRLCVPALPNARFVPLSSEWFVPLLGGTVPSP